MNIDIEDLLWEDGQDNDAGLGDIHYYALRRDIQTFPAITATPSNNTERGKLIGNYTMKAGKFFKQIYCTLEMGEGVSTVVGQRDSKSAENKITLYLPGMDANRIGFLENIKNSKLVFIARQLDGTLVAYGSQYLGAEIDTGELKTGKAITDGKGLSLTLRSIGRFAPIFWQPSDGAEKLPPLEPSTP
jgi:hypothetical protein